VGIRKAIGSRRRQLIGQFISESLAVAVLALMLAVLLAQISLPFFNGLADKQITLPGGIYILGFASCVYFFTGLVSGSYPAFYLSGFEPIKVLKGTARFRPSPSVSMQLGRWSFRAGAFRLRSAESAGSRSITVSITMIIGTIIVFRQIQYAKARPVGYTPDGLITVEKNTDDLYKHNEAIRSELLQTGAITDMGESNSLPTEISSGNDGFLLEGRCSRNGLGFGTLWANYDYGHTMAGR